MPILKYIKRELDKKYPYSTEFKGGSLDPDKYSYMGGSLGDSHEEDMNRDMDPTRNHSEDTVKNLRKNINQFKKRIR